MVQDHATPLWRDWGKDCPLPAAIPPLRYCARSDRARPARALCAASCSLYLIASGLIGEPTAPVIGSAGATNMNS